MSDINVGQLSEVINDKMDRNLNNRSADSGLRKLIESYSNGANWYKVFEEIQSDGTTKLWCEQGGIAVYSTNPVSVTFLKPMQDVNYTGSAVLQKNNNDGGVWTQINTKTTNGFVIGGYYASGSLGGADATRNFNWKVEGYI